MIITGLRTDDPLAVLSRWGGEGCSDCLACSQVCPQKPLASEVMALAACQSCARRLIVCPTGKGRRERDPA
jgi:flavoprotein